jgi:GDP-L-fucose synthase
MMSETSNFNWAEQNVIVTGGSGFLGSYLVETLQASGAGRVVVPRSADYDLRDQRNVERLLSDYADTTLIIHLAATVGGIGFNRANPATIFYDNMMMGTLMLEFARRNNVPKFVSVGTICSYPKYTQVPFREDDLWTGYPEETNAPYGLAKKMMIVQGQAYREQFGYNSVHLLPTNLYGPGDNFNPNESHVIPAVMKKMIDAREAGIGHVDLFGDGSPTREFLYVKDAARGIALAAARYNDSEPVNLGSGYEISIKDLAEKIRDVTGFEGELRWDTSKPNGQPRRQVDTERANETFGFRAQTTFDEGLREMYDWYMAHRSEIEASFEAEA